MKSINQFIEKVYLKLKFIFLNYNRKSVVELDPSAYDEFLSEGRNILKGYAHEKWFDFQQMIFSKFTEDDKNNFLRFDIVSSIMHPRQYGLSRKYFNSLVKQKLYREKILKAVIESPVGNPFKDPTFPKASPLLIQHSCHIFTILSEFNLTIEKIDRIFEFGGGYGSFPRLLKNLGYNKKHEIFDLKFMTLLQKMYLKSVYSNELAANKKYLDNITWISDPESLENHKRNNAENSIFIATWSLSETPLEFREKFVDLITDHKYVFIIYHREWSGIDNMKYFTDLTLKLKDGFTWKQYECPFFKNNYYLLGH